MTGKNIISRCIADIPFICCFIISITNALQIRSSYFFKLTQISNNNRHMFATDIINSKCFSSLVMKWIIRKLR